MKRSFGRGPLELRPLSFKPDVLKFAGGSCLAVCGNTQVLCAVTCEEKVPHFLRGTRKGWLSAEYSLLPCSTPTRVEREVIKGKMSGRTHEIQRLIGRALRACLDFEILGERQLKIDCDVLQADGGTRTTAISGAYVALHSAIKKMLPALGRNPIIGQVAAVSCGISSGTLLVDLDYAEDSIADVDGNFVMTDKDHWVEVQMSAEKRSMSLEESFGLQHAARDALKNVMAKQREALGL